MFRNKVAIYSLPPVGEGGSLIRTMPDKGGEGGGLKIHHLAGHPL